MDVNTASPKNTAPAQSLGIFKALSLFSILSLAAAFIAQHAFDLQPCDLCLYQRFPFAIAIVLGFLGERLHEYKNASIWLLVLSALTFITNAAIAAYHSGVERKYWTSFLEGCSVPDLGDDPEAILEKLRQTPAIPCDEIPWADPIFGLSMANYNILWSLALCALCLYSLQRLISRP